MNYIEELESVKTILKSSGFELLADDILNVQLSGAMGSEILISVCARLLGIKQINPAAYDCVKIHADRMINYARSIGLFPKATYPDPKIW